MDSLTHLESDPAWPAIQAVFDQIYRAWADNDADAFVGPYRDDATVVMPRVVHLNKEQIRSTMAAGFQGPLKGSTGIDQPQSIRIVGDTAVVVSQAGILMAGETELPAERQVTATWVLVRHNGEWQVAAYANAPAPGPNP